MTLKLSVTLFCSLLLFHPAVPQSAAPGDLYQLFFDEIKKACDDHTGLWGRFVRACSAG